MAVALQSSLFVSHVSDINGTVRVDNQIYKLKVGMHHEGKVNYIF